MPNREALKGITEVDTAVIGAGMAGVLTAWFLQEEGQARGGARGGRVGCGQTGGTTAQDHLPARADLRPPDAQARPRGGASVRHGQHQRAVEDYRRLADSLGIACDLEPRSAFVYAVRDAGRLEEECEAARALGLPARLEADPGLTLCHRGGAAL